MPSDDDVAGTLRSDRAWSERHVDGLMCRAGERDLVAVLGDLAAAAAVRDRWQPIAALPTDRATVLAFVDRLPSEGRRPAWYGSVARELYDHVDHYRAWVARAAPPGGS